MIKEAIVKIVDKQDLTYDEAYAVINEIMSGETSPTQNAAFLAERGKLFEVRFVIVPDLYDGEKSVRQAAAFLRPLLSFGHFRIKLIAYRSMGVREAFSHCRTPSYEELCALSDMLREQGFDDIIII